MGRETVLESWYVSILEATDSLDIFSNKKGLFLIIEQWDYFDPFLINSLPNWLILY